MRSLEALVGGAAPDPELRAGEVEHQALPWPEGAPQGGEAGAPTPGASVPTAVSGSLAFQTISARGTVVCAVMSASGAGYCWEYHALGQLGNGTTANAFAPVAVSGGPTFRSISVTGSHGAVSLRPV